MQKKIVKLILKRCWSVLELWKVNVEAKYSIFLFVFICLSKKKITSKLQFLIVAVQDRKDHKTRKIKKENKHDLRGFLNKQMQPVWEMVIL